MPDTTEHAARSPRPIALTAAAILLAVAVIGAWLLAGAAGEADGRALCAGRRATIVGTPGNDVIIAPRWGRQVIAGRGGDDLIRARSGKDVVCGGPGDDRIFGGNGPDKLFGEEGDDRVVGEKGADLIDGGPGTDRLIGSPGGDRIRTRGGQDVVNGGVGPDKIQGGPGHNVIVGAANRDSINAGGGDDFVDGGAGGDRLWGGSGDDLIRGRDGGERMHGGPGDDELYGDLVDDRLWGDSGDDVLISGHGLDHLWGGSGNDLLRGGSKGDSYDGGAGRDTASFVLATPPRPDLEFTGVRLSLKAGSAIGPYSSFSLRSIERVLGSDFDDELKGKPGAWANAGAGNDTCSGFSTQVGCGGSALRDYAYVDLRDPRDPGLVLAGDSGPDRWTITGGSGHVTIATGSSLDFDQKYCDRIDGSTIRCDISPRFLVAWGGDGNDQIKVGGGLPETTTILIDGGRGNDRLVGGPTDDILVDRGGRDTMLGRGGSDALISGPGGDVLLAGGGNDQMVTSDVCSGNRFVGGPGHGDVAGFARTPVAIRAKRGGRARSRGGGRCTPTRIAMSAEVLEGTSRSDKLIGTPRDDYFVARDGNDVLLGMGGHDKFNGGPGRDRCVSGRASVTRRSCERR